ncbi:hypothetical protein LTSEMON_0243 [Salmonella enterica subsp. enterica serovar Montevideo str. S5-403]|uniref:Uncharacterized protein n=1 Tax=Salmonella enterica subsp. enterica serovar Montevideo str. S5-403 TaxID=913242 RepID=G5PXZ8_SALMO|nr:hypothetical protein LTSEMON_0243 [Salmonella enterica subsp. enterica serovar Montevideo str. S5-403]
MAKVLTLDAVLAVVLAGVLVSAALLSAGKPKLAATIPNKRCGQKYRLPNCRQRVSIPLTSLPPDMPLMGLRNQNNLRTNLIIKAYALQQ